MPPELLEYVENGRNPDIYTREFVELVRRGNQLMRGKMQAFASFQHVLAQNMATAMPELRDDVAQILEATGSSRAALSSSTAAAYMNGTAAAHGANSTATTTPATTTAAAAAGPATGDVTGGGSAAAGDNGPSTSG